MNERRISVYRLRSHALTLLLVMLGMLSTTTAHALVFDVNSTADTGDSNIGNGSCSTGGVVADPVLGNVPECTLRAAIQEANAWAGRDRIEFASSTLYDLFDRAFFSPATSYPLITEPVDIDATTAPAWVAGQLPRVRIRGNNFLIGLQLSFGSGDSTVKGLSFENFSYGIYVNGSDGAWIDSCSFGYSRILLVDEAVAGNGVGILVTLNASNTTIGARTQGQGFTGNGNVLSGNEIGILVQGPDTHIVGNFIGTDATGNRVQTQLQFPAVSLGNTVAGIQVDNGEGLHVGQVKINVGGGFPPVLTHVVRGNVISGNEIGIDISESFGAGASGMSIVGNQIGTDIDGEADLGNAASGIRASDADTDLTIGTLFGPNVIGGNGGDGIELVSGGLAEVTISSNRIGVGSDDLTPIGNDGHGIEIGDGDPISVAFNLIGNNLQHGIRVHEGLGSIGDVTIDDNWIGVTAAGDAIPNGLNGVDVASHRATITDNTIGLNNIGIFLRPDSEHSIVQRNHLGTNEAGADFGNRGAGIRVTSEIGGNLLGGVGAGNTIGFNDDSGIVVWNATEANELIGNYIGTNANGDALPNELHGVRVTPNLQIVMTPVVIGSDLTIPSTNFGSRENRIGFNQRDGISLDTDALAVIRGNRMRDNGQLAVDLNADGATPNDFGDVDLGANRSQNHPEMDQANSLLDPATGELEIEYRVTSNTGDSNYPLTIDFYRADASGTEPLRFLGSDTYTGAFANLQRTVRFLPAVAIPATELHSIVAMATDDSGRSSEVGARIVVPEPGAALGLAAGVLALAGLGPLSGRSRGRASFRA